MTNESEDWKNLKEEEKSYTVRVLNWFHFKNNRQSWLKEEVITWELIRLLQIVPSKCLLKNLLIKIKDKNSSINKIINSIIDEIDTIKVEPYPLLGLNGNKKKSRSDIGIETERFGLWIEVKTQIINEEKLKEQIKKQKISPYFNKDKSRAIISLIPENQNYKEEKITWNNLLDVIKESYKSIKNENNKMFGGYETMLKELINRIELRNCFK